MNIITTFIIILIIQTLFFIFAAIRKTDRVTDLAYGSTFALLAVVQVITNQQVGIAQVLLAALIIIWGVRLSGYLYYRILVTKRDKRFDGIRENSVKFGLFWLLQAISIWIILLPATIALTKGNPPGFNLIMAIGMAIALSGIIFEAIADAQKFRFKQQPQNKDKWTSVGLWKYSRHPNYFGEILTWVGVFIFSTQFLIGLDFLSIVSPIYISFLLLFVSGIPTIERKYDAKFINNADYQRYKQSTSLIIPWIANI